MVRQCGLVCLGWMLLCGAHTAVADPVLAGRILNPVSGLEPVAGTSNPAVSGDGRFVFFVSSSNNLGVTSNGSLNLYRADMAAATPANMSLVLAMQLLGSGNSFAPSASNGGSVVAFETLATNLGGTHGSFSDVYVSYQIPLPQGEIGFDTVLVSRGLGGQAPSGESRYASISGDGRFVAFWSDAANLVPSDTNAAPDVFIVSVDGGVLGPAERISVDSSEAQIPGFSRVLSNNAVSGDGRFVAFAADAAIDGANAGNLEDVFVRDRTAGTTSLISKFSNGNVFTTSSDQASISPNARFVVFRSFQTGAGIGTSRIFLRDRQQSTTLNIPAPPATTVCEEPHVSDDADIVMQCSSSNGGVQQQAWLVRGSDGASFRLSSTLANDNGNGVSGNLTDISDNGDVIAFDSSASNLDPGDGNSSPDVFLGIEASVLFALFSDSFE